MLLLRDRLFGYGDRVVYNKLTQVTDFLHQTIPLTRLEKGVLSTPVFNRLHNILQNSTVYLTYPSNRHSRLSHSLGCVHLSGEIFRLSFINGSESDQAKLLDDVASEVAALPESDKFTQDIRQWLQASHDTGARLKHLPLGEVSEPVLRRNLPALLAEPGDRSRGAYYLVLFQAVRLAALLHDLGHPPFSHIIESALLELDKTIQAKAKLGGSLNRREANFDRVWSRFRRETSQLHESIGNDLAEHAMDAGIDYAGGGNDEILHNIIAKHLALRILRNESLLGEAVHGIIDGMLDADRLDYVPRDSAITGVHDSGFMYSRLLGSHRLVYEETPQGWVPAFLPSVQALSSIEEFFQRRLNLYLYVVLHHRVAKTDGLLRQVALGLAKIYLGGEKEDTDESILDEKHVIPSDISGLWRTLDRRKHASPQERANLFMQWDDAWLLTILRRHYFLEQYDQDSQVRVQLEELLSNKKSYHSLFKRPDTFAQIDDGFIEALGRDFSFAVLLRRKDALLKERTPEKKKDAAAARIFTRVMDFYSLWWADSGNEESREPARPGLRETRGFLVVNIIKLLAAVGLSGARIMGFVRSAANDLKESCALDDVFFVEKPLKIGVTGAFRLMQGDKIIYLREVSQIVDELERRSLMFPGFFVYLYKRNETLAEEDIAGFRAAFSTKLAQRFRELLDELQKEEAA